MYVNCSHYIISMVYALIDPSFQPISMGEIVVKI